MSAGPDFDRWPADRRLGLAGPVTVPDLLRHLPAHAAETAWRSTGSPLITTLVDELLGRGLHLSVFTTDEALDAAAPRWMRLQSDRLRLYVAPRRVRAFRFRHRRPGRIVDGFALERRMLADAMRHDRPAVVHAHWSYEYAAAALDAGLPTLVTCHDSPRAILRTMPDLYRVGRYLMARQVLGRASHLTAVSPYLAAELAPWTHGVAPVVVPNPVPDAVFDAARPWTSTAQRASAPCLAMILNGWTRVKNPACGLQALQRVKARWPAATLHLVGPGYGVDGPAMAWARARRTEADFVFHGPLPHHQAMDLLARMDLLLHPAVEESFGLAVAEAMALGIPVVAGAASGGVPWVTGRASGALVDVRSPTAMAEACMNLLSNEAAHARASTRGRERARQLFSSVAVADAYLALCAQLRADDRPDRPARHVGGEGAAVAMSARPGPHPGVAEAAVSRR